MNSYLKYILIVGLPIVIFFAVFFTLGLGADEGLSAGIIMGLFLGVPASLLLGFFNSRPAKEIFAGSGFNKPVNEIASELETKRQMKPKKLLLIFLPYIVVIMGAAFTVYYGKIIITFIFTITLSITITALLYPYFAKGSEKIYELGGTSSVIFAFSSFIPMTITYLFFLFIFSGRDIDKILQMF